MAACCGLRQHRGGNGQGNRKSQQQQQQQRQQAADEGGTEGHGRSLQAMTEATDLQELCATLGGVISTAELDSAIAGVLKAIIDCRCIRIHFSETSPLLAAREPTESALTFSCTGYASSLIKSGAISVLSAVSELQASEEAVSLFGPAPSECVQGLVIPICHKGTAHCLVTFYSTESITDRHRMSLESLKRQLDATCARLLRLASLGFTGGGGGGRAASAKPPDSCTGGRASGIQAVTLADASAPDTDGSFDWNYHPILALCSELFDQDSEHLQLKVINYLKSRIDCDTGFLLLVSRDRAHVFCQVVGDKILPEQIHIGSHNNFFATVIQDNHSYYLSEIPQAQLADILSVLGGTVEIKSLLCVPVTCRGAGHVVAIVCMVNKTSADNFTEADVEIIHECFRYTSTVLTSTIAFQTERMLKNQTQALLQVAQNIFRKLDDLTVLLREIMAEARNLTKAERCSVFLLDRETNELVAKVFDGLPTASNVKEQPVEIRIPVTHGVAGHVATTGELLNIKDAYSHPLFYSKVDENTGFRTRNILCFPIQDEHGTIVGVAQLCNKVNAAHFSTFDEDIARAFSVYCCIAIIHSLMYKRVQAAQARHQLATELMTYHMHVPERGVHDLVNHQSRPLDYFCPHFDQFISVPRHVREADTCQAVIQMFDDLKLTRNWRIRRPTLARFILLARKGYRDPPYHNWSHAFSVAHFTYLCLKNLRLETRLTPLEYFSFMVASLCHDIDHRGTNNSFENSSGSALSGLYSSEGSVLERHHFSQTVCILNREGCNVFENLSEKEYSAVLDIIRDIILATDLAHHLKIKSEIDAVAESGPDWSLQQHRYLMLCLLMTASDLSDQTKVWKNTRQVAKLIYQEFFSLGDKEKSLGKQPAEGMDRDKANIPQLQVNFLNIIAAPVYQAMGKIWPNECSVLTHQIERNVDNWRIIGQKISNGECQRTDATIFDARMVPDDDT